jgi:hypothetical protein
MLENWPAAIPVPRIYGGLTFSYLDKPLFKNYPNWSGADFVHALKGRLPEIEPSVRGEIARFIESCRKVSIVPPEFSVKPELVTDEQEAA